MLLIAALNDKFAERSLARTATKPASLDDLSADISDEARSKDDLSSALYVGKNRSTILARARTRVIIRSAGIARSVGVSSNIHTHETNTRGKWRKGKRLM
jgi:hypothetical protein